MISQAETFRNEALGYRRAESLALAVFPVAPSFSRGDSDARTLQSILSPYDLRILMAKHRQEPRMTTTAFRASARTLTFLFLLSLLPGFSLNAQQDENPFRLDFQGPEILRGSPGEIVEAVYLLVLTPPDSQDETCGWSISLTADNATIDCIWVLPSEHSCAPPISTDASELLEQIESSFTASGLTSLGRGDCEGRLGAASATILGFDQPLFLPAGQPSTIAAILVRFSVRAQPYEATLQYTDGCGRSDPFKNRVSLCPPGDDSYYVTPETNRQAVVITSEIMLRRGDCNDDGRVDISDAICTLNWLFLGGAAPGCVAAVNANGDESTDLSDAVYVLNCLFLEPTCPVPVCDLWTADEAFECETPPASCL